MSARLCSNSPPIRNLGDEIESFLLLYLWASGRYAPNNMSAHERYIFLSYFDDHVKKMSMLRSGEEKVLEFRIISDPLEETLMALMETFRPRYRLLTPPTPNGKSVLEEQRAQLDTYDWIKKILMDALEEKDWPVDDRAVDHPIDMPVRISGKKRKSDCTEYDLTHTNRKRHYPEGQGDEEKVEGEGEK